MSTLNASCMVASLRPALIAADRGASHKSTALPVLAGILVASTDAGGASLTLTGTDLSMRITTYAPAMIRSEGSIVIPAAGFLAFVKRQAATSRLDIMVTGEQSVTLACNGSSVTLRGIAADEFPTTAAYPTPIGTVSLSAGDLTRALRSVAWSAGRGSARPILCGVYVAPRGSTVTFSAFDNYRGSEYVVESTYGGTGNLAGDPVVIPIETVETWLRVAPKSSVDPVTLTVYNRALASLDMEGLTIDTRCVDGSYPSYERVFPIKFAGDCTVSRDALVAAVKGSKIRVARFRFASGYLTITTGPTDEQTVTAVPVTYDGPEVEIGFDPTFWTGLAAAPGDDLTIRLNETALAPHIVVCPTAPQWRAILMPTRLA